MGKTDLVRSATADLENHKEISKNNLAQVRQKISDLKNKVLNREMSYAQYEWELAVKHGERNLSEWHDFYSEYLGKAIRIEEQKRKKEKIKRTLAMILALFLGSLIIIAALNFAPRIIGLVTLGDNESTTQAFVENIDMQFNNSKEITWTPQNKGQLTGIKFYGNYNGKSSFKIFLDEKIIVDSKKLLETKTNNKNAPITAFAVGIDNPQEGTDSQSAEAGTNSPQEGTESSTQIPEDLVSLPQQNSPTFGIPENTPSQNASNGTSFSNGEGSVTQIPEDLVGLPQQSPSFEIRFSEECTDNCNLTAENLKKESYKIRVEFENEIENNLLLEQAFYTIIQSDEQTTTSSQTTNNQSRGRSFSLQASGSNYTVFSPINQTYSGTNRTVFNVSSDGTLLSCDLYLDAEIGNNVTGPYLGYTRNLRVLYHFNNKSLFGENETYYYDYSENNNNATTTGSPNASVIDSGKIMGGYDSNGAAAPAYSYANSTRGLNISNTSGFTIMFWLKARDTVNPSSSQGILVSDGFSPSRPTDGFYIEEQDAGGNTYQLRYKLGGISNEETYTTAINSNWHHITIRYSDPITNGTNSLFVDGLNVYNGTAGYPNISINNNLIIGTDHLFSNTLNGTIDEVAIWNESLSDSDIFTIKRVQSTPTALISQNSSLQSFTNSSMTIRAHYAWFLCRDNGGGPPVEDYNIAPVYFTLVPKDMQVRINEPANGAAYNNSFVNFNVTTGEDGWVYFSLDGGINNVSMQKNPNVIGTDFNYTNGSIADGQYLMNVYSNDTNGTSDDRNNLTFIIDTIYPNINFTNPTPINDTLQIANNFIINLSSNDSNNHSIILDINNSLYLWLRFNNSGDTNDYSSFGPRSPSINGTTFSKERIRGGAFDFNGGNDLIRISSFEPIDQSRTISFWIKGRTPTKNVTIIEKYNSSIPGLYPFSFKGYAGLNYTNFSITGTVAGNISIISSNIFDNQWHQVVGVVNTGVVPTSMELYVDSLIRGNISGIIGSSENSQDLFIGNDAVLNQSINASLDEITIFARALGSAEINASYNAKNNQYIKNFSFEDGTFYYKAYAQDAAGNINTSETRKITIDSTAPIITVNLPLNQTYITSTIPFNFTTNENAVCILSVDSGLTNYSMQANGQRDFNRTLTSVADGSYNVFAYCNDSLGNLRLNSSRWFSVDSNVAPAVTINLPLNKTYNQSIVNFNVTTDEVASCFYTLNSGLTNYSMQRNGNTDFNHTNSSIADGAYYARFYCNDTSNKINDSATLNVSFSIDWTTPSINFTNPTPSNNSFLRQNNIFVNVSHSDTPGDYQVVLDFNRSLVAWFRFGNETGENHTHIRDWSSWQNNATANTTTLYNESGKFGGARQINATEGFIKIPYNESIKPSNQYSLSLWLYPTSDPGFFAVYSSVYALSVVDNKIRVGWGSGSGDQAILTGAGNLTMGQWTHVTLVRSNQSTISLFRNGVLVATNTTLTSITIPNSNITFGSDGSLGNAYRGLIDEAMIFQRAINETEIKNLYDSRTQNFSVNFTSLTDGNYSIQAYTQDVVGHINNTEKRIIVLDTTAPTITINSPLNQTYGTNKINFNITTNENSSCSYSLNGGVTNYSMVKNGITDFNRTHSGLSNGAYNFSAYCNDSLINSRIGSVSFSVDFSQVSSCGNLNVPGRTYDVINDISSDGVCIEISASNITLNGLGYQIFHSENPSAELKDCIGINITGAYNNILIKNTLITGDSAIEGTCSNGLGIAVSSSLSSNISIINNTIAEVTEFSTGISIPAHDYFIQNNTIQLTQGGVAILAYAGNSSISGNIIGPSIGAPLASYPGLTGINIRGNNHLIKNNTINLRDDEAVLFRSTGIKVTSGSYINITNNTVSNLYYDYNPHRAIEITNIINSNISGNKLRGIVEVVNSSDNLIVHNIINTSWQNFIVTFGTNANNSNTEIRSNILLREDSNKSFEITNAGNGTKFIDQKIYNYSFNKSVGNLIYLENTSSGSIMFLREVNGSGKNLSLEIQILNNTALINSTINPGLNRSANITFYNMQGWGFVSPVIMRNGVDCQTSGYCINLTSLTANIVIFNVSGEGLYNLSDTNVGPSISFVSNISPQTITEAGVTKATFNFTVNDVNGYADVIIVKANFTNGTILRSNETCEASGIINSTARNYNCTIGIWYFDSAGTWNVTVYARDSVSNIAQNTTTSFSLAQTAAFIIYPNGTTGGTSFTFSGINPGETNKTPTNNPLTLNNTGNQPINSGISINATNLVGETNNLYSLYAGNFTVGINTGGSPLLECGGTGSSRMTRSVYTEIIGATLPVGNLSAGGGAAQEQLYICLTKAGNEISEQAYSTTGPSSTGAWTIKILVALLTIPRKRKLKKDRMVRALSLIYEELREEYDQETSELANKVLKQVKERTRLNNKQIYEITGARTRIEIPINIFTKEIGGLEAISKYLKENLKMSYAEIGIAINRNEKTIWNAYAKAREKKAEPYITEESKIKIPIEELKTEKLTILEAIITNLKKQGLKYAEISRLLERDQRNIRTIEKNAEKKMNDFNKN
ncbi:MAG: LamG-like jellyroll fold domain-containing protein [Nanoarchaeota archaeon]